MKHFLPAVCHDQNGFVALIELHARTKDCYLDDITIDMSKTDWFDADMCAALGALLYRLGQGLNTITLPNIQPKVETILSQNGFLSHYGRALLQDQRGITIPYQRLDPKDDRFFAAYLERELIQRDDMPSMSAGLLKKFRESIFEIFSNAVIHSQTQMGIFCCGQFFPKRGMIYFSVADLGIGIRQNLKNNLGLDLPSQDAIQWATEGNNTTKRGQIPGGLGLKLLREFIRLNGGCIQIVSDAGYWKQDSAGILCNKLSQPFPGTVVSVAINTKDTRSYALSSELSESDIF